LASSIPEGVRRAAVLAAGLALVAAAPLAAQRPYRVAGRVLRVAGRDSVPVPGIRVTFHRVSSAASGPIDSVQADARGRFRFSTRADSGATYLVSARFAGVAYFSPPLGQSPALDTAVTLLVADTSSGPAAPVTLAARHIVVERPDSAGDRRVTDFVVLRNPGPATRVAPDSVHPSWGWRLPRGVLGPTAGEGDFSPGAVIFRDDSALIFAPISLGEAQMVVQYTIPAGTEVVGFPIETPTPDLNVLTEEGGAKVEGVGSGTGTPEQLDGRDFTRWSGTVDAGSMVTVRLAQGATPTWLLPALIGLAAVALVIIGMRALRPGAAQAPAAPRAPSPAAPRAPTSGPADRLIDRVAALDLKFGGREHEVPAEEWSRYLADRAELLRQIEAALAAAPPHP
jgi:hypothetical protein